MTVLVWPQELEQVRAEADVKFRTVAAAALDGIVLAEINGTIISWNAGAEAIFGYTEAEVLGQPLTILMPERYRDLHTRGLEHLRQTGERHRVGRTSELSAVRKNGEEFPIEISLGTWVSDEGRFFCGIIRDVTERKHLEEALRYAALHDTVSHLTNRMGFAEKLQHAAECTEYPQYTAVLMVDLDDFKKVNDSLGHQMGDALLQAVGNRLKKSVRASDLVARYGGDEFVVLLEKIAGGNEAEAAAARILRELCRPYMLRHHQASVTASIGVALHCGGFQPDDILSEADKALYDAKANGKATYVCAFL